ncbi:MAG: PQQ-dependent dehydrogenase, methanol/ethanol family, partial [Gemmatimonadota bacterium]|nr:PQQ-dependent dehydrogenase, methanol/ethanol family [Gemmatimonadota bacterium]
MRRAILVGVVLLACRGESERQRDADTTGGRAPTVTGARIAAPRTGPPGEWTMPAGDYANSRYSELTQITAANARNLRVALAFFTLTLRGHEGQPLVIDITMYVVTPFPNVAYAFDLAQPVQPLKWKFRPRNSLSAVGQACCDVVNRGA